MDTQTNAFIAKLENKKAIHGFLEGRFSAEPTGVTLKISSAEPVRIEKEVIKKIVLQALNGLGTNAVVRISCNNGVEYLISLQPQSKSPATEDAHHGKISTLATGGGAVNALAGIMNEDTQTSRRYDDLIKDLRKIYGRRVKLGGFYGDRMVRVFGREFLYALAVFSMSLISLAIFPPIGRRLVLILACFVVVSRILTIWILEEKRKSRYYKLFDM